MDFYKPQIEAIKAIKKARDKFQPTPGFYAFDKEFLLYTIDAFVAYRIPPQHIVINPEMIWVNDESTTLKQLFNPERHESMLKGDLKEIAVEKKAYATRVFIGEESGERVLINEKYVKAFEGCTYKRTPSKDFNPVYFYYGNEIAGLAMPIKE